MCPQLELPLADRFFFELLIEEGLFFQRIMYHFDTYKEESSTLALASFPFFTVINHDAIPYMRRTYGIDAPDEDKRAIRTRHCTKILDPAHIKYEEYSKQAEAVISRAMRRFHRGLAGLFLEQPDVGITYFKGCPIYTTYSVERLVRFDFSDTSVASEEHFFRDYACHVGASSSFLHYLAGYTVSDPQQYEVPCFITVANDHRYSNLISPLASRGVKDDMLFFFLSELLTSLGSTLALAAAGFFAPLVWAKFGTVTLYHCWRSLSTFDGYAHRCCKDDQSRYPDPVLREVSSLLSREERKCIKKMKRLRDAFIHYDLGKVKPLCISQDASPSEYLDALLLHEVGMNAEEYRVFLSDTYTKLIGGLARVIEFPACDPAKDMS